MKLLKIGIGILVILGIILAFNWSNLQRLIRVKALFDADKIVHNFSNMDGLLFADPLPRSGSEHIWPVALAPLPETYLDRGKEKNTKAMLEELSTTALVVVKDGTIVFEDYYLGTNKDDLRISWSMSKSFVSALTGLALENGDIESLDDPVTKYAPSLKGSAYDGVSLRNVMNMASGIEFNEDYLDPKSDINKMGTVLAVGGSLDKFAAKQKNIARPAGEAWQYCSIDTHVISMVLRAATDMTLQDYFVENLWSKIGASADAAYSTDSKGNAFALGGLNVRTRDYALFGELFRNEGRRGDTQIIPADWVRISTQASAPPMIGNHNETDKTQDGAEFGYGYQWWIPPNADGEYYAVGVYGQYIYVNPKAGIVIAKNAAHREFMEADETGEGYMAQNITLFRAITENYSDWERR
jgi:CubicO group peptidase (beta-lactamase class C family)